MSETEDVAAVTARMTEEEFRRIALMLAERDRGIDFWGVACDLEQEARRARESEAAKDAEIAVLKMQLQALGNEICALHKTEALLLSERDRLREAIEFIFNDPFVFSGHSFDCNDKAPAELIQMGAEAMLKQIREALAGGGEK